MAADKPVILLIHGAFYQPVHYQEVADKLRERGFAVEVPPLPTTGTNPNLTYVDDVEVINDILQPFLDHGREVVMVAHSSGTLPASHCVEGESVAERAECGLKGGIQHYINVCGLAFPRRGKNFLGKEYESPLQEFHYVEDGILHLLDSAKPTFYNDVPKEKADKIWPTMMKTHSLMNWNSRPKFIDQEMTVPKTYVFCENDVALPTEYQAYFIGVGGYEDVIRVQSGHSPFLSIPERVIEIICGIAEKTMPRDGVI